MAFYSSLADVSMENFSHNNMIPFFGSGIRQNMDEHMNQTLLEKYTGYDNNTRIEKMEQPNFADINPNVLTYQNGEGYITEYERMEVPKIHNNVLPIEKIQVGPGTKDTDPVNASGGFQQDAFRETQLYKDVNELRVKTNPKQSYEGRVVDGKKETQRGMVGKVVRNRVERSYATNANQLLKTTGAVLKEKQHPMVNVRNTQRVMGKAMEIKGNPHAPLMGETKAGAVKQTMKPQLSEFGHRNAQTVSVGTGDASDYGRKNILVYNNERDLTTTRTYEGNVTSYIKSMVAPIMDALKPTNKEYLIQNAREFGQLQSTVPSKQTIYNPKDQMRTTIKETTVHDTRTGNLKGYTQVTTYDPNDVARTTIKETLIHDTRLGNLHSAKKSVVYDPKEVMKATLRNTLAEPDSTMNLSGHTKQTVYNPNDPARTTIKETTIDNNGYGIVSGNEKGGGYATNKHEAKMTNKEVMGANQYIGHPENEQSDGYKNANFNAKMTNKEVTSNKEHFGTAGLADSEAMMSYDDFYNAVINQAKEQLLNTHEPTQTSVKVASGVDAMTLTNVKVPCNKNDNGYNISKIYQTPPSVNHVNFTHQGANKFASMEDRLDPALLQAFHNNPYTKPLDSAV